MLIIDMPMPTRCDRCPCALVIDGMWYCKAFDDSTPIYGNPPKKRRDWCPIICQLPEGHGRLVDADSLFDSIIKFYEKYGPNFGLMDMRVIFNNAPTIVPAERSET